MAYNAPTQGKTGKPIAVDLDGTLVKTDTLIELWLRLVRSDGGAVIKSGWWLRHGLAYFKSQVTDRARVTVELLPYNREVLRFIEEQKAAGRKILLVTASDVRIAQQVADHLKIFDEVMGTENGVNLSGPRKALALENKYGIKGFDYIGNSRADLAVWAKAEVAYAVTNSKWLTSKIKRIARLGQVWGSKESAVGMMWAALRPHQWVKNLLLLIPMLADHQFSWGVQLKVGMAVVVFCLVASAVYLINDLFDLESDRRHPTKRSRPFAAGGLSVRQGLAMVVALLGLASILMGHFDVIFYKIIITYLGLNLLYSLGAKQVVLLDVIILAVLYGLRILAGGAAAGIAVSAWLMALILFLALSGALMKRYIELNRVKELPVNGNLSGRGYQGVDIVLVGQLGITSGYLSVLVLALYLNSTQVNRLYNNPEYWWAVALLLLYGVSRGWLNAYRSKIDDDPVMYILRDPIYYWIIGLTIILALLAI